ncbi:unnamed protein product, partial [Didymodactylos carnosus]
MEPKPRFFVPTIQANPVLVYSSIGKQANLKCIVQAPPDTTITWKKMNELFSPNTVEQQSTKFWQSQHGYSDTFHATLNIKDVQKEDYGFYMCIAESITGRSNATVELKEHRRTSSTRRPIRLDSILSTTSHLFAETLFNNTIPFRVQSTNFISYNLTTDDFMQQQQEQQQKLLSYNNQTRTPLLKREQQQNKEKEQKYTVNRRDDDKEPLRRRHSPTSPPPPKERKYHSPSPPPKTKLDTLGSTTHSKARDLNSDLNLISKSNSKNLRPHSPPKDNDSRAHASRARDKSPELSPEERDMRTVFCMQLAARIRPRDLEEFFAQVGKVRDVRLITDPRTRRSKGVAYVEFRDLDCVTQAISLSGQKVLGVPIIIKPSNAEKNRLANQNANANNGNSQFPFQQSTVPQTGPMKLYVGSLHFNITEEMLRGIFEPFGRIE